MLALEDRDGGDAYNVDENIKIKDEETSLDHRQARKPGYPTQYLATRLEVQDVIVAGM